jgi:hypothetical protein
MQSLYYNNRYFSMKHSIRYYSQRVTTSLQRPQQPMYDGTFHRSSLSLSTTRQIMVGQEAQRIQKNVARLYARRILEIAAASAALQRCKLQQMTLLEDPQRMLYTKAASIERPADWENWSRREWSFMVRHATHCFINMFSTTIYYLISIVVCITDCGTIFVEICLMVD